MNTFRFGMSVYKKHLKITFLCLLLFQILTVLGLYFYKFNQLIVDYVLMRGEGASGEEGIFNFLIDGRFGAYGTAELLLAVCVTFALFLLVRHICVYLNLYLLHLNGVNFEGDLRRMTMRKLLDQSSNVLNKYNTGELLTILNFDCIQFKDMFAIAIPNVLNYVLLYVYCFFFLFAIHPLLVIPAVAITPLIFFVAHRYVRAAHKVNEKIRDANSDLNMCVQENINAVRVVRSFAAEDTELGKFDEKNKKTRDAYFENADVVTRFRIAFDAMRWLVYLSSIALGAYLATVGKITIGDFSAFISYVMILMNSIIIVVDALFQCQVFSVAGGRIQDFLNRREQIVQSAHPLPVLGLPHIEIKDVSLDLDNAEILENIDLDIPFGKRIGVIGGTGSGKSVLFRVVNRFLDPTSGSVLLNGIDIREYELDEVRRQFSYVPQDVFLFSDTVSTNISYYNEKASDTSIRKCAEIAQADDFIRGLPNGYDTVIGERGVGLSGGQKQRLSIARALLKAAPVIIFDDATSALDTETEQKVFENVKKYYKGVTMLISAHRISSIEDMDEIIYMDRGRIVERGTHSELIEKKGLYYETYMAQMTDLEEVTL